MGPDGGWLSGGVLDAAERWSGGRQAWLPAVGSVVAVTFLSASLGTLFSRGETAQVEACEGQEHSRDMSGSDIVEYCAKRAGTAPVVSYSGILAPERWVFGPLGTLIALVWGLTFLLVHGSLQRLADEAWARKREGRGGRSEGDGQGEGEGEGEGGGEKVQDEGEVGRPAIAEMATMEPLVCVLVPTLLIVVWVSLGMNYVVHIFAAGAFFLMSIFFIYLTMSAQTVILDMAQGAEEAEDAEGGEPSDAAVFPSRGFISSRNFKFWVLCTLVAVSVPVSIVAGLMYFDLVPGWEHIIGPMQYSWILTMLLGSASMTFEIRDAARLKVAREEDTPVPPLAGNHV